MTLTSDGGVRLRGLRAEDADGPYLRWMNDPEVTRFLESRFYPATPDGLRRFLASATADGKSVPFAIVTTDGDRHIGNIKIGGIDWIHRAADVGLLIGEKDCWGKGYGTSAIRLATQYAFDVLNLRRAFAGIYAPNTGCIRAFEKAGYCREGVKRRHYFCEGEYVDGVMLGVLRDEFLGDHR